MRLPVAPLPPLDTFRQLSNLFKGLFNQLEVNFETLRDADEVNASLDKNKIIYSF